MYLGIRLIHFFVFWGRRVLAISYRSTGLNCFLYSYQIWWWLSVLGSMGARMTTWLHQTPAATPLQLALMLETPEYFLSLQLARLLRIRRLASFRSSGPSSLTIVTIVSRYSFPPCSHRVTFWTLHSIFLSQRCSSYPQVASLCLAVGGLRGSWCDASGLWSCFGS